MSDLSDKEREALLVRVFKTADFQFIKELIQNGLVVKWTSEKNEPTYICGITKIFKTPLCIALNAISDNDEGMSVILFFLQQGYSVNPPEDESIGDVHVPLARAVTRGHVRLTELLLSHGAAINLAVFKAIAKSFNPEYVKRLLAYKVDINAEVGLLNNIIEGWHDYLQSMERQARYRYATKGISQVDKADDQSKKADDQSKTERVKLMIQMLLAGGADPNSMHARTFRTFIHGRPPYGSVLGTLFQICAKKKREDVHQIFTLLLKNGLDLETTDENGQTALIHMAIGVCAQYVKFLLDAGASVGKTDDMGNTALINLGENRKHSQEIVLELAQCLTDRGANVNAENKKGDTFLFRLWLV